MPLGPLEEKFGVFGWEVRRGDGHDFKVLRDAFKHFATVKDKPKVFIADTIKGKGVSFMEDDNNWHYRIPDQEQVAAAKRELGVHA